jgi:hypothetical protein
MLIEGKSFSCVDFGSVAASAAMGAVGGGLFDKLGKVRKASKRELNAVREAAKEQFRREAAGLDAKIIRSGRDGTGKIVGVGTTKRKGPTYRPKGDGSYSVGTPGKVKHFRSDGNGGYTVNKK